MTDEIEVEQEPFCPPSIVSPPGADHPLDQIVRVNLSDSTEFDGGTAEERFQVTVRDCNVEQDLEAWIFMDFRPEFGGIGGTGSVLGQPEIQADGSLERDFEFTVSHTQFVAARELPAEPSCHKIELRVSSDFAGFQPDNPSDIARAIWWVAIPVGLDEPELRSCP